MSNSLTTSNIYRTPTAILSKHELHQQAEQAILLKEILTRGILPESRIEHILVIYYTIQNTIQYNIKHHPINKVLDAEYKNLRTDLKRQLKRADHIHLVDLIKIYLPLTLCNNFQIKQISQIADIIPTFHSLKLSDTHAFLQNLNAYY